MNKDYMGIVAICGPEGSGKTTVALSFPKPMFYLDVDVGGYERAAWRLSDMDKVEVKRYFAKVPMSKITSRGAAKDLNQVQLRSKIIVEGAREMWDDMATDIVNACAGGKVKTVVIDSHTMFWQACHRAWLQQLQEKQVAEGVKPEKIRERLKSVEYGPANERMKNIFLTARGYEVNLILPVYPRNVYTEYIDEKGMKDEVKTSKLELDSFNQTAKLADVVCWTDGKNNEAPVLRVEKFGGTPKPAMGQHTNSADYQGLIKFRRVMRLKYAEEEE